MLDKLEQIAARCAQIEEELASPAVYGDPPRLARLSKEQKELSAVAAAYQAYKNTQDAAREAQSILSQPQDPEFRALAQEEYDEAREKGEALWRELELLLLPRDEEDEGDAIVEIRGGVGGEEAALFAAALYRMYSMYAEKRRFKIELMSGSETELGGYKEVVFSVSGAGAFARFKFESGVHRVQRVPETEAGGRIHTSAASVAVLPEADEVAVEINPGDLQIDTYRSGGAGGQHVNKTESAIRITHLPTGVVVECQDERSQHKNKERAMKILRARLLDAQREAQDADIAAKRRGMVGSGDRSQRIRTYNYAQNRLTDHRINLTLYKLDQILSGDLDEMVDALTMADQARRLQELGHTDD